MLKIDVEASLFLFLIKETSGRFGTLRLLDDGLLHPAVLLGEKEFLLVVFLLILRDLLPNLLHLALILAVGPLTYGGYGALLFLEGQWDLQVALVHLNMIFS